MHHCIPKFHVERIRQFVIELTPKFEVIIIMTLGFDSRGVWPNAETPKLRTLRAKLLPRYLLDTTQSLIKIHAWLNIVQKYLGSFQRANPGLFFVYFRLFSTTIFKQKSCRIQRDSNSDRWSRRRAHWPLDYHQHPVWLGVLLIFLIHLTIRWLTNITVQRSLYFPWTKLIGLRPYPRLRLPSANELLIWKSLLRCILCKRCLPFT